MRPFALLLKISLFLLFLGFAVKNSEPVTVHYLLGWQWQAPLSLILLIVFALGLLLGLLACAWQLLRDRRELAQLRKAVQNLKG